MNGHTQNPLHPTKVWQSLVKTCLPPQDRDAEFWWQLTGYHLAKMLEAADYAVERQYEILLFYYHWIVPRLGAAPEADGRPKWKSLMSDDCSPLEFSWKWNTATSGPEVRYSWEAFNPGPDSCLNPLNHALSLEYFRDVSTVVPDADFTWCQHFLGLIEQGDRPSSSFLHAVDHRHSEGLDLKSYLVWRNGGAESTTKNEWDEAITKLDPNNSSHHAVKDFLTNNSEGKLSRPVILAWDNLSPSKSRLKWYFLTENTSFTALREIMTIGGLHNIPEDRLQDLRSFITTILELPDDYPEDARLTSAPPARKMWPEQEDPAECFAYFFDIAPGRKPEVKFYLPTRRFGGDDLTIARRLIDWLKVRGRGDYGDRYLSMMHALAEHRGLVNGKGLHSYISYQFTKSGVPDIKSYLVPEAFHPARFPKSEQFPG